MTARYWFRTKTFGYGASPSTWQGWAVGVAYVMALLAASIALVPLGEPVATGPAIAWGLIVVALTAATLVIAWRKTDGAWRWRWAKRNAPQAE
jgi:hypothetical protein